jgi:diguanylate cyclase (GGDEF)-like protein
MYVNKTTAKGDAPDHIRSELARLLAENEELRASLDQARNRVSELELLADTDTLTPLPNRRCFVREVEHVIRLVGRYGSSAAIMYVDLDSLKRINDAHGHHGGDQVLLHVAALLRRDLRATDLVARIGGDEFGLLLHPVDEVSARSKRDALQKLIANSPISLSGKSLTVRLSFGLAMVGKEDTIESLMSRADTHMYASKPGQRSDK